MSPQRMHLRVEFLRREIAVKELVRRREEKIANRDDKEPRN